MFLWFWKSPREDKQVKFLNGERSSPTPTTPLMGPGQGMVARSATMQTWHANGRRVVTALRR